MKKKKYYSILNKKNRHLYGCFNRNKDGLSLAKKYKEKLQKEHGIEFVIK
jgi:hypothetical protein